MASDPPHPVDIVREARWLAHRYDPDRDVVHFVDASREARSRATFLTDEHLPTATAPVPLSRASALAAAPPPAPMHFIFHSAYCCSTLLARAFDLPGVASMLKEPVILNDLSGWRRRGAEGRVVAARLDDALRLLARPFVAGEAVIVKPSNVIAALTPAVLALRPDARALLLHAPLPTFLASIAMKGMWGRLWVRELLAKLFADGAIGLGFTPEDLLRQTDLQVAATGWLVQHRLFADLVARFGAARVRTLDSETLLDRPTDAFAAIASLYALPLDRSATDAIARGPVFMRNAKDGAAFDRAARDAAHRAAAAAHLDEIDKVVTWATAVAHANDLSLALPAPLLSP